MLALVAGLSLSASPLASNRRQLSQTLIGKYAPNTDVRDHANIDLDQKAIEDAGTDFAAAKLAWGGYAPPGGFSKVTATCTLQAAAIVALSVDDKVSYTGADGLPKLGTAAVAATSGASTSIVFKTQVDQNGADSRVDVTVALKKGSNTGSIIGTCYAVTYSAGRSLQGFSTGAKAKMLDCAGQEAGTAYANGCPYTSYKPYYDYYCLATTSSCNANGDYVHQAMLASLDGLATSGISNFDWSSAAGTTGNQATLRKDFTKKISKFAGAGMYAVHEFEDAIDDCSRVDQNDQSYSDASVHAWDQGVAFFVGGSLVSTDFYDQTTGEEKVPPAKYLAYTLGNERCKDFKTCGRAGDLPVGEAFVNYELWKLFGDGRDAILSGNCAGAVPVKNKIVELMSVPLIQGTLLYSWYCDNGKVCTAKQVGELAAFAFSILPQVHACDSAHATTIATAANPGSFTCTSATTCTSTTNSFAEVKAAFEACYTAMGVSCALVGGLYDGNTLDYRPGASPCDLALASISPSSPPTVDATRIDASFTLSGSVSDYDDTGKAQMAQAIATGASVEASAVAIAVEAASVQVTATITVAAGTSATSTQTALESGIMADAASLEAALTAEGLSGVTVTGTPSVTVIDVSTATPSSGLGGGALAGIAIGAAAGGAAAATLVVYFAMKGGGRGGARSLSSTTSKTDKAAV